MFGALDGWLNNFISFEDDIGGWGWYMENQYLCCGSDHNKRVVNWNKLHNGNRERLWRGEERESATHHINNNAAYKSISANQEFHSLEQQQNY